MSSEKYRLFCFDLKLLNLSISLAQNAPDVFMSHPVPTKSC